MVFTYAKVFAIVFICMLVRHSESHELSKDFERCKPTDSDCILKRANDILHNHHTGNDELLLGSLEPFLIDDIKLTGNPDSPVNVNWEISDLKFYGFTNMTFTKFTGITNDPKDIKIETESVNPHLILKGRYKINGKLLVFPITGNGDFESTLKGLQIKSRIKPQVEVRNGKTYLKMDVYKLKVKADGMTLQLTNLFNGDKTLSESMIKVMNDNWKLLWDELEPKVNEQLIKANRKVFDKIMNNFSFEDLFILN